MENQEKVLDPLPSFSSGSGPAPPTTVYQRFLGTQSEDETLGMTPRCSRARGKLHSINILHIIRWQFLVRLCVFGFEMFRLFVFGFEMFLNGWILIAH